MEGLKKEILLAFFPKITLRRYKQILAFFNSLDDFWQAKKEIIQQIKWEENLIDEFLIWKQTINEEEIKNILEKEKIYCLTIDDELYPKLLKKVYDPPFCLFVRGNLNIKDNYLAVVGSRKNSLYGKQITEKMVYELSQKGLTIVSGLAFGIDSIAHKTCLKAGGKTIAILGSGLDEKNIYPQEHLNLAKEIIDKGGAIISEYPPETPANFFTFPRRNRIIAGISLATFIVEAQKKSGALITAEYALENGREIFTVPQNISSENSQGTNELIKNGANLITDSTEILAILNLQDNKKYVKNKPALTKNKEEEIILSLLSEDALHIDNLIKKTNLGSQKVNQTLSLLEIKGLIQNLGNMMYILKN